MCYVSQTHVRTTHPAKDFREEGSAPGVTDKGESPLHIAPKMFNMTPAEPGGSTGMLNENSTPWLAILRCSLTSSLELHSLANVGWDAVVCPSRGLANAERVLAFFSVSSWGGLIPP